MIKAGFRFALAMQARFQKIVEENKGDERSRFFYSTQSDEHCNIIFKQVVVNFDSKCFFRLGDSRK